MLFGLDGNRYLTYFWYQGLSKYNFSPIYDYLKFEKIILNANSPVWIFAHLLLGEYKYWANFNTVNVVKLCHISITILQFDHLN